ncbi:hypothetical protein TFLX_05486 [Thermoflexales bacterium]|nr:hypothetical protein TFLX_05486 [Thermoflexales bacterium]
MIRSSLRSFFRAHASAIIANGSLIIVGLILAAPLLQNAWLCSDDGALHVYRTMALDRALSDGLLYPRWFPDLAYGYGFPFFNYREPLGYYLVELVHLLGASFPLALNLVLAGSLIASGLTLNLWVSDIFDRPAGFVAAIVYLAAPYTVIDVLTRSNLPESIALALMPLSLWTFRRLLLRGGRKYFAGAVLSLAALLLTHNISSLIFVPVLVVYVFVLRTTYCVKNAPITHYALRVTLLAFVLALALTAFFWLPALTEGQSAQLYLTHSARGNDYHFNFATLAEVFGSPGSSDPSLLNPPLRIVLGWAQITLAMLGVLLIKRLSTREQRAHVIIAVSAAVIFIVMALPVSLPLWETLPLIRFVQFPWRFVGRAILPVALLAGAGTYCVGRGPYQRMRQPRALLVTRYALLTLFTLPVLLSVTPLLYPRVCPGPMGLTITDVFAYERATGHTGVDPLGAYLPVTVVERPSSSTLEAQYAANEPIRRFDRSTLPEGAQLIAEDYRPNHAEVVLATPTAFLATYLTFHFPGWRVAIDGQPIPIVPSHPHGLITFEIPAGRHAISVAFEDTPARRLANGISLAALLALGLVWVFWNKLPTTQSHASQVEAARQPVSMKAEASAPETKQSNGVEARQARVQFGNGWFYLAVPALFLLLKILLIDPQFTPLRQTQLQQGALQNVQTSLQLDYGDQLRLLGYCLAPGSAPSGETVRVDLYWRALRPLEKNYQTTVGLVDANGEVWNPKTLDRPRDYQDYPATNTWPVDVYAVDSFELPINPGTPPGTYAIFAEVFERGSLLPLPAQASAVRPSSRPWAAQIGSLAITPATRSFAAQELGVYNLQADQLAAPEIKLIGANRDRDEVLAGETVLLTLFWQAGQKPAQDYAATIELIGAQDQAVLRREFPLGAGRYPTTQWNTNEQIVDLDRVRVPVDLARGVYYWRVSIGRGEPIELGDLRVTAPDRVFGVPSIAEAINQTWGGQVTLLGFENSECGTRKAECGVKLWWRAEQDMPEAYKVFVHLLDANGVPRAQVDVLPQNGARPTWSWLPGEIIADEIVMKVPADLPAGPYRLTTGLYNELDGMRLTLPDGKDYLELATIEIEP